VGPNCPPSTDLITVRGPVLGSSTGAQGAIGGVRGDADAADESDDDETEDEDRVTFTQEQSESHSSTDSLMFFAHFPVEEILEFTRGDYNTFRGLMTNPTSWWDDSTVAMFLAVTALWRGQAAAVAHPDFMGLLMHAERNTPEDSRLLNSSARVDRAPRRELLRNMSTTLVYHTQPDTTEPMFIAVPIHVQRSHWVLAVWVNNTRDQGTVFYFDPLGGGRPSRETERWLATVMRLINPGIGKPLHVFEVPPELMDQQRDPYNCGPHICQTFHQFMRSARHTKETNWSTALLNIAEERECMLCEMDRIWRESGRELPQVGGLS
jgi:Ulp1 protease family, C-terminal catalytic domain